MKSVKPKKEVEAMKEASQLHCSSETHSLLSILKTIWNHHFHHFQKLHEITMIEQIWETIREKTRLGNQAMESHYVNVDSVTRSSSNSTVFLNCIFQLYFSIVFINGISQLYLSSVFLNRISELYFLTVFFSCISQLYFLTVFFSCISLLYFLTGFLNCISQLYFPNVFLNWSTSNGASLCKRW